MKKHFLVIVFAGIALQSSSAFSTPPVKTATAPTLVSKGINPKLLEGEGVVSRIVQEGEYWRLCASGPALPDTCLPIVPTYVMEGVEVQVTLANDGTTPLITFKPTSNSTRTPFDQARSVDLFMERLTQATKNITGKARPAPNNCLRTGRQGGGASHRKGGSGDNCSNESADDGGGTPIVDVPGHRDGGDLPPMPSPVEPNPPVDGGGGEGEGGGGGGGSGEGVSPDDATPLKSSCVFIPPPAGIWACTVPVQGKRPGPDNLPPPPLPNWCALTGLGCTTTNDGQPPNLNPLRDMCNSRFVVEAAQCIEERVKGHTDREHELLCIDKAQAKLALCVAKSSPLYAPATR